MTCYDVIGFEPSSKWLVSQYEENDGPEMKFLILWGYHKLPYHEVQMDYQLICWNDVL